MKGLALCEDEADNIDEYPDKMRIYKNGYTTGRPILKTDTTYGRKQYRFNTFCFKAFAAERLPDSVKAKGFNQRIIEIPCVYGFPEHDISESLNPAGELEHSLLLGELMETRNSLLVYRLQHRVDTLPDIKTNLKNREKQLFKPVLRVFHGSAILDELLPVISKYVGQKREENASSLYAFLYRTIRALIQKEDNYEIGSNTIWDTITDPDVLPGEFIPNKKLSYDTVEFNTISQKQVIQICKDVFGAVKSKHHGSSRKLLFDKRKLDRLAMIYDLSLEIKVTEGGTDGHDGTDVGLDRHLNQDSGCAETNVSEMETQAQLRPSETGPEPDNASQASQASQDG